MNIKFLIIGYVLIIGNLSIIAGSRLDSLISAGMSQIYNIQFEAAEKTFKIVRAEFPRHPSGYFFKAAVVWWRILLDLNVEKYDEEFYDDIEKAIEVCDEILDENPNDFDALFYKGGALGYRGRLLSIRKNFFSAALDAKDAMPLIQRAYTANPKNIDVLLGFGIYNYYTIVIPEAYPIIKPLIWFLPPGDKEKGLAEIEKVALHGNLARLEALYFLAISYTRYEKKYNKTLKYVLMLHNEFPDNPRFESFLGRTYIRMSDWKKGVEVFRSVLNKSAKSFPGYLKKYKREASYYVGEYQKNHNNLDSAYKNLYECVRLSRELDGDNESGFLINGLLYLGMVSDMLGRRNEALKYYTEVTELREHGNSRELAELYLKKPYGK